MRIYDRKKDEFYDIKDSLSLRFLYHTVIGRIILKPLTSKLFANMVALYQNSRLSKLKIKSFIKKNNINMDDYINTIYSSFNDFFTRRIKNSKRTLDEGIISPCDAKLTVYKIDGNEKLNIKDSIYTVSELIGESDIDYRDGYALVYRLCVYDYHRYIYPFDGKVLSSKVIPGKLHTVQPIALKQYKVFHENAREVTFVESKQFGKVSIIEVGALIVGKIVNNKCDTFKKGDEKGHFEFGGSTIVYLFQKDKINLNEIFINNTKDDIETVVKMGENLE